MHDYVHEPAGTPDKWTEQTATVDVMTAGGRAYLRVAATTGNEPTGSSIATDTMPAGETREFYWTMFEGTGDVTRDYEAGFGCFFTTTSLAGDGYLIHQTETTMTLKRYNAGTPTTVTSQSWAATHGRRYYYYFRFDPSTGDYVVKRGTQDGLFEDEIEGTDASPLDGGATRYALLYGKGTSTAINLGFDAIRILSGRDEFIQSFLYNVPLHKGAGGFEFTTVNDQEAEFDRYALNDRIEIVLEDGTYEYVDFYGIVEVIDAREESKGQVRVAGRDFLSPGLNDDYEDDISSATAIGTIMAGIVDDMFPDLTSAEMALTGDTIIRSFKGKRALQVLFDLALEAEWTLRVARDLEVMADKDFRVGGFPWAWLRHVLTHTPSAAWNMDELRGVTAVDWSANGNHGVSTGGVTIAAAGPAQDLLAYSFDGSDDYIDVPNDTSLQPESGDFSVEFWIMRLGAGAGDYPQVIGSRPWVSGAEKGWAVAIGDVGGSGEYFVSTHFADGSTGWDVVTASTQSASELTLDVWEHWIVVFDRTNGDLIYYKNGVLNQAWTPTFPSGSINQAEDIYIGREIDGGDSRRLNARLAGVAVYKEVLSPTDVLEHYRVSAGGPWIQQADGFLDDPIVKSEAVEISNLVQVLGKGVKWTSTDSGSVALYGTRKRTVFDERIEDAAEAKNLADEILVRHKNLVKSIEYVSGDAHGLYPGERIIMTLDTKFVAAQTLLVVEKIVGWPDPGAIVIRATENVGRPVRDSTDSVVTQIQQAVNTRFDGEFTAQKGLIGSRVPGLYYTTEASGTSRTLLTGPTLFSNRIYAIPFAVAKRTVVENLAIELTVAAASGKEARLGIYRADGTDGSPGTLVFEGMVLVDVAGPIALSADTELAPGLYYLALLSGVNTYTVRALAAANALPLLGAMGVAVPVGYTIEVAPADPPDPLPSPFGSGSVVVNAAMPAIFARFDF